MYNNDIDFIARHYRKDRFSAHAGWRRLGIVPASRRKKYRVAAAVAATVLLSATAAIIYQAYVPVEVSQQPLESPTITPLAEVRIIDFENASLTDVVKKIEEVYDVKVENLPDNQQDYELSLHYEGTPTDLISAINDILGTQMKVTEK